MNQLCNSINTDEENVEAKDIANASSVSVNNDVKAKEKTRFLMT